MRKVQAHACDVCECVRLRVSDFDRVACPELTLCPMSRWISNECNLTAVVTHARRGWEEELVNGG